MMHRGIALTLAVALLTIGACACFGAPQAARAPRAPVPLRPHVVEAPGQRVSTSPRGRYEARYAPPDASGPDARGELAIVRRADGQVVFRLRVERSAEVIWSPDDERAAVLDHFGSNEDRLFIVALRSGRREQTIGRDNFTSFVKDPERADYSHLYFERLTWPTSRRLRFRAEMWAPYRASARPGREVWVTIRLRNRARRSTVRGPRT